MNNLKTTQTDVSIILVKFNTLKVRKLYLFENPYN